MISRRSALLTALRHESHLVGLWHKCPEGPWSRADPSTLQDTANFCQFSFVIGRRKFEMLVLSADARYRSRYDMYGCLVKRDQPLSIASISFRPHRGPLETLELFSFSSFQTIFSRLEICLYLILKTMSAFPPDAATDPSLPHDSLVPNIRGVCSAMLILVTLVVGARFWIHLVLVNGRLGPDDWLILVAWVLAAAFDLDPLNRKSSL